jgi:hypothetical protein
LTGRIKTLCGEDRWQATQVNRIIEPRNLQNPLFDKRFKTKWLECVSAHRLKIDMD